MKVKILQNLIVIFILIQISNQDCDINAKAIFKRKNQTTIAHSTSGWGGPPEVIRAGDYPNESDVKEYFYIKTQGKASKKAIEQKVEVLLSTTCKDAAGLQGSFDILSQFMDAHIQEKKGADVSGTVTLKLDENNSFVCKYTQSDDKKLKSKDCHGTIKNRGSVLCWATAFNDSWESCECLNYIHFPGGRDAVLKKLEFIE